MGVLADVGDYLRILRNVPVYVRNPLSEAWALATYKERLERRDEYFLKMVSEEVFANPQSPYLFLFKQAGCEAGDIAQIVKDKGLDEALEVLSDAGVYVKFDEFKGRAPIERNGRELHVSDTDFDNPLVRGGAGRSTSGSTGAPTRLKTDWRAKGQDSWSLILNHKAQGLTGAPIARFGDTTPANWGVGSLVGAKVGHVAEKWFRTIPLSDLRGGLQGRLGVDGIRLVSRICGVRLPRPEVATPLAVAQWMRQQLDQHGRCLLGTGVSNAVRVAAAATENGVDLTGAVITSSGEPATWAKAKIIRASGARWAVGYGLAEAGEVGAACPNAEDPTDVHVARAGIGIIQRPFKVGISGQTVQIFRITNFRRVRSKVMINVELDDFGIMEERDCGCLYHEWGFRPHLRQIFSHSKLTGEGVTLVGGWTLRILEEFLPAKFGGTPIDYQLIEEENESGQTQVTIAVSPRLGPLDEAEVVKCFLGGLSAQDRYLDRAMWEAAGTLRVTRREPIAGNTEKVLPLYRTRKPDPSGS